MKKFFALFLAAMMLLSCAAMAETVEPLYVYDPATAAEEWQSFTGT